MASTSDKGPQQPANPSADGTYDAPGASVELVAPQESVADGRAISAPPGSPPAQRVGQANDVAAPWEQFADPRRTSSPPPPPPPPPPAEQRKHRWRLILIVAGVAGALAVAAWFLVPMLDTAINTVSTDDAYVNGHVTFVAPRVAGQVTNVLVDDNVRVKKGALLAQLDKVPYEVQVRIRKAAVASAEADLYAARAQVRGLEAQARAQRWQLQMTIEQVRNKVAQLRADVATHESKKANRTLAQANLRRGEELAPSGGVSKEDLDQRRNALKVADAEVEQTLQVVYADRVYLGLQARPSEGEKLTDVPPNLDQTFSSVRSSLANLLQTTSQLGLPLASTTATPNEVLDEFRRLAENGDVDQLLARLVANAPAVKQAEAKLLQAQRDLEQAQLNLSYCDIVADIDGVITRRNVNPGNNIQVGQGLMAIRSLREIWIDANFKETQLADLRIGQRARLDVDMYGSKKSFEGRITGFTMGTGSTLSLLPAQNATGNFVKVVQRLPVRIELTHYDPDKDPLFIGLSVEPYVYYKEPPQGPHAGDRLQPISPLPELPVNPTIPPLSFPFQKTFGQPGNDGVPVTGGQTPTP